MSYALWRSGRARLLRDPKNTIPATEAPVTATMWRARAAASGDGSPAAARIAARSSGRAGIAAPHLREVRDHHRAQAVDERGDGLRVLGRGEGPEDLRPPAHPVQVEDEVDEPPADPEPVAHRQVHRQSPRGQDGDEAGRPEGADLAIERAMTFREDEQPM